MKSLSNSLTDMFRNDGCLPEIPVEEEVREKESSIMTTPSFHFKVLGDLDPNIFLPSKKNITDTGYDVAAAEDCVIQNNSYVLIPLGIAMIAPPGWWIELRPRSSTFAKKKLHALYGVIDEEYENQIMLAVHFMEPLDGDFFNTSLKIAKGEKIAQLVPVKRVDMNVVHVSSEKFDEMSKERNGKRGLGGFGSQG